MLAATGAHRWLRTAVALAMLAGLAACAEKPKVDASMGGNGYGQDGGPVTPGSAREFAVKVGDTTVEQLVADLSAKIGEKLVLRRAAYFDGTVETYLHKRAADLPPAVGVLVEYSGGNGEEAAHAVALQIAALKARYLTREDVPEEIVANERRIAEETAKEEGKPEAALPKIVEGRVNGFYKDVVLLDQPSVSDNKKTVKALLDEAGVTVSRFVRFEVGQA